MGCYTGKTRVHCDYVIDVTDFQNVLYGLPRTRFENRNNHLVNEQAWNEKK
jgi:hypothetical protein